MFGLQHLIRKFICSTGKKEAGQIEEFVERIPKELRNSSGKAFHSGRLAFSGQRDLYVLGFNPGGVADEMPNDTVAVNIDQVRREKSNWTAFLDENWSTPRRPHLRTGGAPMQMRVQHLLRRVELNPREVPASDLFFVRSRDGGDINWHDVERFANLCWPFHRAVISKLGVRVILCMGRRATPFVQEKTGAFRQIDSFVEDNKRGWRGACYSAPDGLKVVQVPHPSQADWTKLPTDPSDFVKRALAG